MYPPSVIGVWLAEKKTISKKSIIKTNNCFSSALIRKPLIMFVYFRLLCVIINIHIINVASQTEEQKVAIISQVDLSAPSLPVQYIYIAGVPKPLL